MGRTPRRWRAAGAANVYRLILVTVAAAARSDRPGIVTAGRFSGRLTPHDAEWVVPRSVVAWDAALQAADRCTLQSASRPQILRLAKRCRWGLTGKSVGDVLCRTA